MECGICAEPYDLATRQALSLACGHSLCQTCLQALPTQLCPICCQPLHFTQINPIIQNAIAGYEVYCHKHLTPATSVCLAHMCVMCADCGHQVPTLTCLVKDLYRDTQEIWTAVMGEIDRVSAYWQGYSLPPEVMKSLGNRYNLSLTVNIQLLWTLYDLGNSSNATYNLLPSP